MLVQCGGGRTGSASSRQSYQGLERAVYDASQGCGWQLGGREDMATLIKEECAGGTMKKNCSGCASEASLAA
jgi:hypothetical protein